MSVNLGRSHFSMPETLVGGIALAAVGLIAIGGLRVAEPRLSAPADYAPVSIATPDVSAKSSIVQPPGLSAGVTRDLQSRDFRLDSGDRAASEPNEEEVPRPPAADRSVALTVGWPVGTRIQQHGIETDSLGVFTDVIWGVPSSDPFRASPIGHPPRRHVPDPPSVRADSSFIGNWTDDVGRCRAGRKAPLVISSRAAKTDNGECDFGLVARDASDRWRVTAICAVEGKFWRANIALKLTEPKLTWSSERGTRTYVRCKR
jgi:hypothetical protein